MRTDFWKSRVYLAIGHMSRIFGANGVVMKKNVHMTQKVRGKVERTIQGVKEIKSKFSETLDREHG